MNKQEREKQLKPILEEIKQIADKYGEESTKSAVNRWYKGITERKKLEKKKVELERQLQKIKANLE